MGPFSHWPLSVSLAVVLVIDQVLKGLVLARVRGPGAPGSIVRIRPRPHRTVAARFGVRPVVLAFAWLACFLVVLQVAPRAGLFDAPLSQAALGAALGGAAGNLFDMLVRSGVVDYVELGAWPSFNLADVAIVVGVTVGLGAG